MNVFKGCFISKDSVFLTAVTDGDFYNHLSIKPDVVVDDSFRVYASSLIGKSKYNRVNLLSEFQFSPFVDNNDWAASFNDYLVRLRVALGSFTGGSSLISQINGLLGSSVDVDDLDARLVFVSSINSCFSNMSGVSNLSLRSVLFVNEEGFDSYDGLSFWFGGVGDLSVMSLYQFSLSGGNSFLFDERLSGEVGVEFNRCFGSYIGSGLARFNDGSFTSFINGRLNSRFYNNDRFSLEPLLYFLCEDKMVLFSRSFGLDDRAVEIVSDISMSLNSVESVLFNGFINPLLSFVYFKSGSDDLLLVQDVKDNSSVGVVYRLVSGNLSVNQIISNSKTILTDYLINPNKLYNI